MNTNEEKVFSFSDLKEARDKAYSALVLSARHRGARPWADDYSVWCCADQASKDAYTAAVSALGAALRGTKYGTANPHFV